MSVFINGLGNISPQLTYQNENFLDDIIQYNTFSLKASEPNYNEYLNPRESRRMSRIVKMGLTSSIICLREAGIDIPDAIVTGTGLGCLEDTEKFLTSLIEQEEKLLSPTSFIHSTHNTVSSQIAMFLKCKGYNLTYCHRGFSFESALLDSMMLINEGNANNVLVGGIDVTIPKALEITKRLGIWKDEPIENTKLLDYKSKGTIAGEGSSFFVISNKSNLISNAEILDVSTLYNIQINQDIETHLLDFLKKSELEINDIDLVILGLNGDIDGDNIYYNMKKSFLKDINIAYYKHLCGDYQTSTAFALWLGAKILKNQTNPEIIKYNEYIEKSIKYILIYNHYLGKNHSFILLRNNQ